MGTQRTMSKLAYILHHVEVAYILHRVEVASL
jgi:hypothetical protein